MKIQEARRLASISTDLSLQTHPLARAAVRMAAVLDEIEQYCRRAEPFNPTVDDIEAILNGETP